MKMAWGTVPGSDLESSIVFLRETGMIWKNISLSVNKTGERCRRIYINFHVRKAKKENRGWRWSWEWQCLILKRGKKGYHEAQRLFQEYD